MVFEKTGGILYIVSTPIGNLKDITYRAVEILKTVTLVAAEDTRQSRKLFAAYDIHTPLTSYHSYNARQKSKSLINKLLAGANLALVTDSGTPGISDPGAILIRQALENHIHVLSAPGPTALIPALILSGKDTSRFVFEGFLSNKTAARRKKLRELQDEKRTIVFYESPHRIVKMLRDVYEIFGDRPIACMRELTKKFEEHKREKVSVVISHFEKNKPRGEFVIII